MPWTWDHSGRSGSWKWPTRRFYVPEYVDDAMTLRQDRFTWQQFLALGLMNHAGLWELGVSHAAMAAVARQTYRGFRDSYERADQIALEVYRGDPKHERTDRPKQGRGGPSRPWGPKYDNSDGYAWEIAIAQWWNATLRDHRYLVIPRSRSAAGSPGPRTYRTAQGPVGVQDVAEHFNHIGQSRTKRGRRGAGPDA